jgi:hypothetical protein
MRIAVVINSCLSYSNAIQSLLNSLNAANVPSDSIFVVLGESPEDKGPVIEKNVNYLFRRWSNIDNNAMISICLENICNSYDWIVYLHDTCLVTEDFWAKTIMNIVSYENKFDCIAIHSPYSMGIGYYSVQWLQSQPVREYMMHLVNYDVTTEKKIQMKNNLDLLEDTLFKFAYRTNVGKFTHLQVQQINKEVTDIYGNTIPRLEEYYPNAGIRKLKANYGQPSVGNGQWIFTL